MNDGTHDAAAVLRFGPVEILAAERRLRVDGRDVPLGGRAFDLLLALATHRQRLVSKDELIDWVWPGLVVEENNLQVQISALRKALGAQAITTVAGRGYRFTLGSGAAPVAPLPQGAQGAPAAAPMSASGGQAHAGAPSSLARAGTATSPARVLVADDNKVNRLLLCRSLELMGHAVTSVDNGRAALQALRGGDFELLLLDLEMPELDGFAVLEHRAEDAALRELPVIVTSSVEGVAQVARCIELGADDFLHKPVNPLLLKARVNASLESGRWRAMQRRRLAVLDPRDGDRGEAAPAWLGPATRLAARLHDVEGLARAIGPEEALEAMGAWATLAREALAEQGGIDLMCHGDSVSGSFAGSDGAEAALRAARDLHAMLVLLHAEREAAGLPALRCALGLASGDQLAGPGSVAGGASSVAAGALLLRAEQLAALSLQRDAGLLLDAATAQRLQGQPGLAPAVSATGQGADTLAGDDARSRLFIVRL